MNRRIETVLIAEDDFGLRECLGTFLETLNLKYIAVSNGFEATQLLKTEKIDLLLTDFRMPLMNGLELLAWCRGNFIHIPVIFISSKADSIDPSKINLSALRSQW